MLTAVAHTYIQRERMRRGAAALTFPAVRAIVQEIFTALLFAAMQEAFTALVQARFDHAAFNSLLDDIGEVLSIAGQLAPASGEE